MAKHKPEDFKVEDFFFFKIKPMWRYFWSEHPAFWFICGYLFVEYFRPQSIYPQLDILPWASTFLLAALLFSIPDRKSKFQFGLMGILIALFALHIRISFFTAYSPSWSYRYQEYLLQWVIVYFLLVRVITTPERFYIIFMIFFLASLKIAIGTTRQWMGRGFSFANWGLMGPPGYFQNSGELAIQMLILFGVSVVIARYALGPNQLSRVEKGVIFLAILSPILTILGASSRGSQIALLFLVALQFYKHIFKPRVLTIVVVAVIVAFALLPEEQKSRFSSIGEDQTSVQRLLYWKRGSQMIFEHPFLGVGYYNFVPYFSDNYPNDVLFRNATGELVAELPHNILIQVGTDAGFPALVIYLLILGVSLAKKAVNPFAQSINRGLKLGIVGFFIAGQFVTVTYYPFLWVSLAMQSALIYSFSNKKDV